MIRLVHAYDRGVRRLLATLESLHTGALLGLLRRRSLERLTSLSYRGRALYAEPGYNASGLLDWERGAFEQHFPSGSRLLVAGCGGGREMLALAEAGHEVDGFDPNAEYVAQAGRALLDRKLRGRAICAKPDAVPAEFAGPYEGLVLGWGMYTHVIDRDRRVAFLRELRGRANASAPLLLSFWTRASSSRRERFQHGLARFLAACSFNPRRPEAGDDLNQQAFVHWFDETEISEELKEAGFLMLSFSATPYGHAVAVPNQARA